ncbi:DUF192 domain-containing protein [Jannaschia rubra]|uniref:ACR n=1 Tax=Jannaschia rubra TaxID=282197 RepID=A0A0M6XV87_9RHOB|nr:DUF192 domain-containing protein [Jannaschia rubra]CTQ34045.1 hypothetical protein JAN5088_02836 [Jannaschia rubra]SFG24408.1 hypothetical protein SAMN04488517_103302 [Jannaschia rubra]
MGILRRLIAAFGLGAMIAWGGAVAALTPEPACAPGIVDIRGDFGSVRLKVDLALTPQEQARGLMFRESMPRFSGMLFVYPRESQVSFWMRNTLIPLDMIFVGADGRIVDVHENAVPLDETPIPSAAPALAVLEVNGGLTETLGIDVGDALRSSALPQDNAAWPCD